MKITKSERHKIYIKAYSSIEEGMEYCICGALINSDENIKEAFNSSPLLGIGFNKILFPEFALFEPSVPMNYWFDDSDERLTALAFMIAITETK